MSDGEWKDIPRDDYRVTPKPIKRPKRKLKSPTQKQAAYAFIKANLAVHGILRPDGGWRF